MVDMPSAAVVVPRHSLGELLFDVRLEEGGGAADILECSDGLIGLGVVQASAKSTDSESA
jgi:hypothetical protein